MLIFYPTEIRKIESPYGPRSSGFHHGVDFPTSILTPLVPAYKGEIAYKNTDEDGYGVYIVINHKGYSTLYGHLDHTTVKVGQEVTRKSIIGFTGNSGYSTGPHLHFELRNEEFNSEYFRKENGRFLNTVNPIKYLPQDWEESIMERLKKEEIITSEHHPKDYPTFAVMGEMLRKAGVFEIKKLLEEPNVEDLLNAYQNSIQHIRGELLNE